MNIKKMTKDQLREVRELDGKCFNRIEKRSMKNVTALWEISDGGGFVGEENDELIAYLFTHRYGNVGTIGPLGVLSDHRKKGYAKEIIAVAITFLQEQGCTTIGLEVLPDKVENIGLYSGMGFQFVQPSVLAHFKCYGYEPDACYKNGNEISIASLEQFNRKFLQKHEGYSLYSDVCWVIDHSPDKILFYVEEDEIKGFLSYNVELYQYVWGYLSEEICNPKVTGNMFGYLAKINSCDDLPVRINMKYFALLKSIFPEIYIEKIIERMVLCNNNEEMKTETGIILRSWIG